MNRISTSTVATSKAGRPKLSTTFSRNFLLNQVVPYAPSPSDKTRVSRGMTNIALMFAEQGERYGIDWSQLVVGRDGISLSCTVRGDDGEPTEIDLTAQSSDCTRQPWDN